MERIRHLTTSAKPREPGSSQKSQGPAPPPPPRWRNWLIVVGIGATLLLLFLPLGRNGKTLTYTEFVDQVQANNVKTASIRVLP